MKCVEFKAFNINQYRPKVLLVGNGLFYEDCNWDQLIDDCCSKKNDAEKWKQFGKLIPYTIRASIACDVDDNERWNQYKQKMDELKTICEKDNSYLAKLLELQFDAIITTNYTYQIENSLDKNFTKRSDKYIQNHHFCCTQPKGDSRFLIHSFNRINDCEIWHMHGEARRKSSMVLTHDEYGRFSGEVRKYLAGNANYYHDNSDNLKIKSWIDYLLLGDVYVIGYGADFSEFVFWWMLGRRLREKAGAGAVYFYEPIENTAERNNCAKLYALEKLGVNVLNLGYTFTDKYKDYAAFYHDAITDIDGKMGKGKSHA